MSTKADALIQKAARGERVKSIRDALELSGDAFAAKLNEQAAALGARGGYDKHKVSRLENGGRQVTAEEVAILTMIDPGKRDAVWLVFGVVRKRGKFLPRPGAATASGGRRAG